MTHGYAFFDVFAVGLIIIEKIDHESFLFYFNKNNRKRIRGFSSHKFNKKYYMDNKYNEKYGINVLTWNKSGFIMWVTK